MTYTISVEPERPEAGEEVTFSFTPSDPALTPPRVEDLYFGDGDEVHCEYRTSNGGSEECRLYHSDAQTQHCYHTYAKPGRYEVTVTGTPGKSATATGKFEFEVVAAPGPSPLLPPQQPRRDC